MGGFSFSWMRHLYWGIHLCSIHSPQTSYSTKSNRNRWVWSLSAAQGPGCDIARRELEMERAAFCAAEGCRMWRVGPRAKGHRPLATWVPWGLIYFLRCHAPNQIYSKCSLLSATYPCYILSEPPTPNSYMYIQSTNPVIRIPLICCACTAL